MTEGLYGCKFCRRRFDKERIFMKHVCTPMERAAEIQTPVGQTAYALYRRWLEGQKRLPPPVETFLTSNYYTSFVKFAEHVRSAGIPDPQKYIELMLKAKISPALWRKPEAYQLYLDYVDKQSDPYEQVQITVETLQTMIEGLEIPPADVFTQFKAGEILDLIQQRKLSPWLLFCSKSFKAWVGQLEEHERTHLMRSIGIEQWSERLQKRAAIVDEFKEIAEALGI